MPPRVYTDLVHLADSARRNITGALPLLRIVMGHLPGRITGVSGPLESFNRSTIIKSMRSAATADSESGAAVTALLHRGMEAALLEREERPASILLGELRAIAAATAETEAGEARALDLAHGLTLMIAAMLESKPRNMAAVDAAVTELESLAERFPMQKQTLPIVIGEIYTTVSLTGTPEEAEQWEARLIASLPDPTQSLGATQLLTQLDILKASEAAPAKALQIWTKVLERTRLYLWDEAMESNFRAATVELAHQAHFAQSHQKPPPLPVWLSRLAARPEDLLLRKAVMALVTHPEAPKDPVMLQAAREIASAALEDGELAGMLALALVRACSDRPPSDYHGLQAEIAALGARHPTHDWVAKAEAQLIFDIFRWTWYKEDPQHAAHRDPFLRGLQKQSAGLPRNGAVQVYRAELLGLICHLHRGETAVTDPLLDDLRRLHEAHPHLPRVTTLLQRELLYRLDEALAANAAGPARALAEELLEFAPPLDLGPEAADPEDEAFALTMEIIALAVAGESRGIATRLTKVQSLTKKGSAVAKRLPMLRSIARRLKDHGLG